MYDRALVLVILAQIDDALQTIERRFSEIRRPDDFLNSESGKERLDGLCMLFIAVGDAIKQLDRITGGTLLDNYPLVDWKGAKGFRDVVAHHYFDLDAEQVFWICTYKVGPLRTTIRLIRAELQSALEP